jgi:glycosyltransferase involved in cell wall biosynthesis
MSIFVHTNGIRCLPDINLEYDKNKIVFIGNMRTLQNQDAVGYFAHDIFPIVKEQIPDTVFYIIGAEPPPSIGKLSDGKNIIVSGFVESVEDAVKDAAVSVAPIRIAAGIQNKVLVSMACGVPVVLTSLVAGGIPELMTNKNCLVADEKEVFAQSVILLLQNNVIRNTIAKAGYNLMREKYSWDKVLKDYELIA